MKLTAMLIAHNEADRFLKWTIPALFDFVDEVRVVDDNSTDGTHKILADAGCVVKRNDRRMFFEHEGRARNELLDWALEGQPDALLAIDCDELVEDGAAVRNALETRSQRSGIYNLSMTEVWSADESHLYERVDGQWGARRVPIVFEVPARRGSAFRIADRALACGREPMAVAKAGVRQRESVCNVYHLGWACEEDRQERYDRYAKHDGGQFHRSAHLESIMYPDELVTLMPRPWPESMQGVKAGLLDRINR